MIKNVKKKQTEDIYAIEPGLIKTFKVVVFIEGLFVLAVNILLALSNTLYATNFAINAVFFVLICYGLMWGYLHFAWFKTHLQKYYLPLGLILFSLIPIMGKSFTFFRTQTNTPINEELVVFSFTMIIFWFVPVMLTAWQYRFFHVILMVIGTLLMDILSSICTYGFANVINEDYLFIAISAGSVELIMGNIITQLMVKQRSHRQSLAAANQQLVKYAATQEQLTISRERNRLALELHDTLVHTLSSVSVQLEAMRVRWDVDPEQSFQILQRVQSDTREGLAETRQALKDLRVMPLADLGLIHSIENMASSASIRSHFHLNLTLDKHLDILSYDIQQYFYRITQEALRNIEHHACAKNVHISLKETSSNWLCLTIKDDGCGFIPEETNQDGHFGLVGMKERTKLIGGMLIIDSIPGKGTTIQASLEAK